MCVCACVRVCVCACACVCVRVCVCFTLAQDEFQHKAGKEVDTSGWKRVFNPRGQTPQQENGYVLLFHSNSPLKIAAGLTVVLCCVGLLSQV